VLKQEKYLWRIKGEGRGKISPLFYFLSKGIRVSKTLSIRLYAFASSEVRK
jgi:hypothetical protein